MAVKPYLEGKVWSFRLRLRSQAIYRTGFATSAEASREAGRLQQKILDAGQPKLGGPWLTTLAQALQSYAQDQLPFLKGARQEADRINRYLRAAGLEVVRLSKADTQDGAGVFWRVMLEKEAGGRVVPNSLLTHRTYQASRTAASGRKVRLLAKTTMASITPYALQELVDAWQGDGLAPATVGLERALLRQLFNHARKKWLWPEPARNPAAGLRLPAVSNERNRVLTNDEWERIAEVLQANRNPLVAPALALLLETAMRVSEPLLHATWADVDWQRCVLRLQDAKAGAREVPLTPGAVDILRMIQTLAGDSHEDAHILPVSYESLKAAWRRACEKAGVADARIHDLRHTAATRFTLELNGSLPILKVITGHKTYSQLSRYINVKPEDVARLLHGRPLTDASAPAGYQSAKPTQAPAVQPAPNEADLPPNVIALNSFRRTAAA